MPGKANDYKPGVRLSNAAKSPIGQSGAAPMGALAIGGGQEPLSLPRSVLMAPAPSLPMQAPKTPVSAPGMQAPVAQVKQAVQQAPRQAPKPQAPVAQYQAGQAAVQQALPGAVLPFPANAPMSPTLPASVMQQQAPVLPTTANAQYMEGTPPPPTTPAGINDLIQRTVQATSGVPSQVLPNEPAEAEQPAAPTTSPVFSEEERAAAKQSLLDTSAAAMEKAAADIGDFYGRQGLPHLAAPAIAQEQANIQRSLNENIAKLDLEWAQAQEQSRQFDETINFAKDQWNEMEPTRKLAFAMDLWSFYTGGQVDAAEVYGLNQEEFLSLIDDAMAEGIDPRDLLEQYKASEAAGPTTPQERAEAAARAALAGNTGEARSYM